MKNLLVVLCCLAVLAACNKSAPKTDDTATTTEAVAEPKPTPDYEFTDVRYNAIGKQSLDALASGDIDGWMNLFSDDARYFWSSGDSLVGKAAISSYWKDRRTKVIDSLTFTNDIWMPVKINKSQRGPDRPGVWLLGWYFVNAKYKNGHRVQMWIHMDLHFNESDKIDQVVQYMDRAPVNAALAMKKK